MMMYRDEFIDKWSSKLTKEEQEQFENDLDELISDELLWERLGDDL